MLNEMRFGMLTPASIAAFKSLSRPIIYDDGVEPTELFPRREDVERCNTHRSSALVGEEVTFEAFHGGTMPEGDQREKVRPI